MAGYSQDPLQYIRLIADNLRDRYESGFPVLKEIIQNADDAGSEAESIQPVHLDFGLTSGIPGAGHPLLKGPALYFINDGDFTEKDNRAIHSFGLNSKAAEEGSIGKFGLGMKSVFHFCEAFFFQAKGNESDKVYAEILNPWSSGSDDYERLHADWDDFSSDDAARMRRHLGGVLDWENKNRKTCFLLWLPLRRREHLDIEGGQTAGSIIEAFPGDDLQQLAFLHETDLLAQRLAALFPLLRRLTRIRFWENPTDPNPVFTVELDGEAERIRRKLEDTPKEGKLRGKIRISTADAPDLTTAFTGKQCLVEDSRLLDLKKSHLWPKSYTRDSKGRSQLAQDKTQAHSAAVFSFNKADSGTFITDWAVFLPVGGELSDTRKCEGSDKSFRLTLHGYFFVDAGRAGIEGFPRKDGLALLDEHPADETALRRLWNSHLARLGVFPLILPALKDFVAECRGNNAQTRLSDEDIWNLSNGLAASETFKKYRSVVCAKYSWIRRLTKENRGWQLLSAGKELRVLPPPPKSVPERPWGTFPQLSAFENRGVVFVEKDSPHLVATPLPQWNVPDLWELLQIDAQKVFSPADGVLLDYLTQFLEMDEVFPFTKTGEIQARLREIFRRAFHAHGSALSQHREKVRTFASFILPENRFRLKASDEVVQALQEAAPAKLLLNQDFDAQDNPGTARFTPDETLALLHELHELIVRNVDADTCRGIARGLVQALPEDDRRAVLNLDKDLKILSGHDCLRGKQVALSIRELENCRNQGLLFRFSAGIQLSQQLNVAPLLQAVIQERVLLVNKENRETFGLAIEKGDQIPTCDASAVLAALGNVCLDLQDDLNSRLQLLKATATAGLHTLEERRGLRYLLHGAPQHFSDQDTLWVPGDGAGGVWGKIWAHLQRDASNRWTLLDRQLVDFIPPINWSSLGLKPVNISGMLDELQSRGPHILQGISLSLPERETVLLVAAKNQSLWQGLPLHETVDGRLVSITDGQTYLHDEAYPLPDGLAKAIDLIVPSDNRQVRDCQTQWITPINPENILRIALKQPDPHKFSSLILDQLDGIGEARLDDLVRLIPDLLLKKRWLLDADRNPVKPEDVIDLPEIADEVNRLVAEAQGVFSSPENLSPDVQNHPNFNLLRQRTFSRNEDGLKQLALLLEEIPDYWVGELHLPGNAQDLLRIAHIGRDLHDAAHLPGWGLLARVAAHYPDHWNRLTPALCQVIEPDKIVSVLAELQQRHVAANNAAIRNDTLECFNLYLAALVDQTGEDHLAQLMLLNRAEQWRASAELCTGAVGVADSHLLDDRQRDILYAVIDHANQRQQVALDAPSRQRLTNLQPLLEESKNNLRSFFKEWRDVVPAEEMICAFLVILGKSMEEVADEFKGKGSLGGIQNQIPWERHKRIDAAGRQEWMYDIDKNTAFNMFDFLVSVTDGAANIQVTSILGDRISVPQQADFVSLIVGKPFYEPLPKGRSAIKIDLRRPDRQTTPNALSGYLREAAEYLLREAYNQQNVNLSNLWAELDKYDQLDINVAQTLILESLPPLLRQLGGVHKHDSLREEFKKWEDARRNAIEFQKDEAKKKEYEEKKAKHLEEIQRRLLEEDEVQEAVFMAVRGKMKEFQYTPQRMPFELFQNADDAVVEYLKMQCHPQPPPEDDGAYPDVSNRRVVVAQKDGAFYFAHWGRWINEVGVAPFDGRKRYFHCDLEKMLMLSASDKADDASVTGKFGLGFKSVFLVSAKPKLVSGRLAAEIVGGLCPIPLENEDAQHYREELRKLALKGDRPGTLVALPLDENAPDNLAEEFVRRAGLLCIFAKRIRQIDVDGIPATNGAKWEPAVRHMGGARLEFGEAALSGDAGERQGALHFRFSEGKGGILFGMSAKGFCALPKDVPGIWVVAPTEDAPGLGLAVNGRFELDVGRTLLAAKNEDNADQADALGRSFSEALVDLYSADWPETRDWLRLAGDVSQYDFWHSLWDVLTKAVKDKAGEGHELISRIVAGHNGFGALLDRKDALPNGLWGDFRCLTRPDKIKKVVKGVLAEEEFFLKICEWGFFRDFLGEPAALVAEYILPQGKNLVPRFGEAGYRVAQSQIDLRAVLHEFFKENQNIDPPTAAILGGLREGLDKEKEEIKGELQTFRFRAKDGNFHESGVLLVAAGGSSAKSEESRVAAFAPDEALLDSEYQDDALTFFKICRGGFKADIDDMTEWFLAADTPKKQSAALRYLLEGNQGDELAERVRERKVGTWLAELAEQRESSACFDEDWSEEDIEEILVWTLRFHKALEIYVNGPDDDAGDEGWTHQQPIDPEEALENIHKWWMREQNRWIRHYEEHTYPDLHPSFNLEEDDVGRFDRSSWLALFLLGHFHTMGLNKNVQHKGFISLCERNGWWKTFSEEKPETRSDAWMRVLETYISAQVDSSQYEAWMNHYVSIYKLSRHLDAYRDAFLSIDRNRQGHTPNLDGILKTLTNPDLQGGGIAAPPIDRTLGLGACFVVRELRRKGLLNNPKADLFCYVPVGRVREICSRLGCFGLNEQGSINDSKTIYDFLCRYLRKDRATFAGCYDIPLQILAENEALRQQLLY